MNAEKLAGAGRLAVSLLGGSWRIRRLRPSTGIRGRGILYAFWHGVQLPLIYTHRNMGIRIMISRSRDGTLVSSVCEKMGFSPVRGSSSRGGVSAARELVRSLAEGLPGAITPDGPAGPAGTAKPGVSLIPSRSRAPVVPYGVGAFPAVRLNSWDRFMIPLPFATLAVAEGRPVPPGLCSPGILTAAIDQQQSRAQLAVSPGARILGGIASLAGGLASPAASLILRSRDTAERHERMGRIAWCHSRPVWLHGASLGELKGLLPVTERLREMDIPFFVTVVSPAGRDLIRRKGFQGSYLPLDIPSAVNRFLDRLSPRALVLAETEFWPVLLRETALRGIPAGLINGRLSGRSLRGYRLMAPLFTGVLRCFRIILTRTEGDTRRFCELGLSARTAGDGKSWVRPPDPDPGWSRMISPGPGGILVAGSTRKGEERIILETAKLTGMTPVIVPRHDSRLDEILGLCREAGFQPDLWTDSPVESRCLVVNVKGVLAALYALGDLAFVGGTIAPVGGHNILEPLSQGIPVIVGPHHHHFSELVMKASEAGMCRVFSTPSEAASAAAELSGKRGESPVELPERDFGAIVDELLELLEVTNET